MNVKHGSEARDRARMPGEASVRWSAGALAAACGAFLLLAAMGGRAESEPPTLPRITPQVFAMVTCWMSDTVQPVVTEFSLDAVNGNDDQFDRPVTTDGPWICTTGDDGEGFLRYRVLSRRGDTCEIEFQSNGGGTLTSRCFIGFRVASRVLTIDGARRSLRVLRIESFRSN